MSGIEEHRSRAPERLGIAIVTVSDTRTMEDDASGDAVVRLAEAAGHFVADRWIVADELPAIRGAAERLAAEEGVDLIVVTGGTGVAPRDVTVGAVEPLFERRLPGFGELFRMLSYQEIGAAAMLSRAVAGIVNGRPLFALPGSTKAVELAMTRLVLPEAGHLVGQLRL